MSTRVERGKGISKQRINKIPSKLFPWKQMKGHTNYVRRAPLIIVKMAPDWYTASVLETSDYQMEMPVLALPDSVTC